MTKIAGEWWENVDVWAIIASSIVGILVGVLGAWATLRSANPKLRLQWWTTAQPPLIDTRFGGRITVSAYDVTAENPRIVQLSVANVGRRDITSAMFHNDERLKFEFGSRVLATLAVDQEPEEGAYAGILLPAVGGNEILFSPGHIRRGQVITLTFLLDGQDVGVRCRRMPLVDIDFVRAAPGDRARAVGLTFYETLRQAAPFPLPRLSRR
ncbi:hypothetical protein [Streptomyces sp. NPDC002547]